MKHLLVAYFLSNILSKIVKIGRVCGSRSKTKAGRLYSASSEHWWIHFTDGGRPASVNRGPCLKWRNGRPSQLLLSARCLPDRLNSSHCGLCRVAQTRTLADPAFRRPDALPRAFAVCRNATCVCDV